MRALLSGLDNIRLGQRPFLYLNVNVRSSAETLFCGSGCPFSACLLVFNLLFMSREHWFSFEREGSKFNYLLFNSANEREAKYR